MNQELYNALWGHSLDEIKKHALAADDINSKNKKSETALMSAVKRNSPEIVIFLLTIPTLKLEVKNKYQQTALFLAAQEGESTICEILLNAGAKINSQDYSKGNVLMAAVQNPQCFNSLLKYKPDMHCRNGLNMSCLTYLYNAKDISSIEHLVSYSQSVKDIENFHQQRTDIYNYHVKSKSLSGNEDINERVHSVIEKVKLKIALETSLNQKHTKPLKSKI